MGDDAEKKGKEMTAGESAASKSPEQEFERTADAALVPMGHSKHASMRRTQRVYLRASAVVYVQRPDGSFYSEDTHTLIVSANGALLLLAADLKLNERLLLINQRTRRESECYVACLGDLKEGKREVGVGFVQPAPNFWGMTFPPEDWDPATRKKPTGKTP